MTDPLVDLPFSKTSQTQNSPGRTCGVEDCGRVLGSHDARGLCGKHYFRLRHHGTTDPPVRLTRFERWVKRVDATGDCWLWRGATKGNGYSQFGTNEFAHRVGWELLVGPVPDGLELDHLCRNKACVNPDHLEPVTRLENLRRGAKPGRKRKTHCIRGHALHDPNIYYRKDGSRACRTCRRLSWSR